MTEQGNNYIDNDVIKTREDAKQLADLYLALAQKYRILAGLQPIATQSHQRILATNNTKRTSKN